MAKLKPILDQCSNQAKVHFSTGDRSAAQAIMAKHKEIRKLNGLFPIVSLLNLFSIPFHLVNFSMIQYFFRTPGHYMNIILQDQGLLWFTNLMAPDPLMALPIIGATLSGMNIYNITQITSQMKNDDLPESDLQNQVSNYKKYFVLLPFIGLPITTSFPAAFNLYMCMIAGWQFILVNSFSSSYVQNQNFMKIKYTKEFRNFMESTQVKQVDLKTDENINYE